MSNHKELDEYTDEELKKELERREICAKKAICHYCNQPLETHTCKYSPMRHFICKVQGCGATKMQSVNGWPRIVNEVCFRHSPPVYMIEVK